MSRGIILMKAKEIIAKEIDIVSFARGSKLWMGEFCRVYWNTSRNDKLATP